MIKSISIITLTRKSNNIFDKNQKYKIVIAIPKLETEDVNAFDIEIKFSMPIVAFRNHDYTWVDVSQDRMANSFCPKIIKLQNGFLVQANINQGIWEINKKKTNVLVWRFNPEFSNSITEYTSLKNYKKLVSANTNLDFTENPALLFSKEKAIEFSRSPIPFSAIACFTDHCDFDTNENLKQQRLLFKETNIKVTKGFFLNHFSKREHNASFEKDKSEIELWKNDGHELCYHSLSQSIKSDEESFNDFEDFTPPYQDISVWIDHGFQPYNFSLYKNNTIQSSFFENQLAHKKITTLWNYIDSGTATNGVINQLNSSQFTMNSFLKGIKDFSLKTKMILLFKNIIFHYDNDEKRVRNYIDAITATRLLLKKKKITAVFSLLKNSYPLLLVVLKVLFFWNSEKNKPYKIAQYAPLVFKHTILEKTFYVFQTLEMVDFKKGLHPQNIDLLIKESGVFIAHTYFSVDMKHYSGKLFKEENVLDEAVVINFHYLFKAIRENKIWNPTLSEMITYFDLFEKTVVDIDDNGMIFIKSNVVIPSRNIN